MHAFNRQKQEPRRSIFLPAFAFLLLNAVHTSGQSVPELAVDLRAHVKSIRAQMPGAGSNGFVSPSSGELTQWRSLVNALLQGEYTRAADSLSRNFKSYRLLRFTDTGYRNRVSYMLQETPAVVKGWGTYWFNSEYARELSIAVPHPIYDADTETEAVDIFRETAARALLLAGTHRCANSETSPCDGATTVCGESRYRVSDAAHFARGVLQSTHEEILTHTPNTFALNLHGHGSASCPDFFLSNGALPARQILFDLQNALRAQREVSVGVYGDGGTSCDLTGTTNVQGRFQNGSPDPCAVAAAASSGYFIHLEQSRRVRETPSLYAKLIVALQQSVPMLVTHITQPRHDETPRFENFSEVTIHPNPFVSSTAITFAVTAPASVSVEVYNLMGQFVRVLQAQEPLSPRYYTRTWDGRDESGNRAASGIYLFRTHAGTSTSIKKVLLLRS